MIDQQEETEAGASRDDLGAPFSLSALCEESTYSPPPLAGGGMACGYRAPSGVAPPGAFPAGIPADANRGLCIGRSCADHRGLGGLRPPTSGIGYTPMHCLPLLSAPINEGCKLLVLLVYFAHIN